MKNTFKEIDRVPDWMDGSGELSDIVMSSRVRLARNISGFNYSGVILTSEEEQVRNEVMSILDRDEVSEDMTCLEVDSLRQYEKTCLLEKHLVSSDLLARSRMANVIVSDDLRHSIMINEEDHLRFQSISSGFDLERAWKKAEELERLVGGGLEYDFHQKFGFLTSCPTNTGTGLRASVLIHLPALVLTKEIQKVLRGITQIGLTFRGLYGEGSEVVGNLFQISNQVTIGKSEKELVDHLVRITTEIVGHERNARGILFKDAGHYIQDKVWRAYGILEHARTMSSDEVMNLLSAVRLGISMKLIKDLSVSTVNRMLICSQDAHLEVAASRTIDPAQRDVNRADVVRSLF